MKYKPRIVLVHGNTAGIAIDTTRTVLFRGNTVGIAIGTKMDPNYIVVNLIFPSRLGPQQCLVFHKDNLTFTSLLPSDLDGITTVAAFQQAYPEYFI